MLFDLPKIEHNLAGFKALLAFYAEVRDISFENIEINMQDTQWFDADMCAAFGALLYKITNNINTVKLMNSTEKVKTILTKNEFLRNHFGASAIPDHFGTTITYRRFGIKDGDSFEEYLETEFVSRPEVPLMSDGLRKEFKKSIGELFSNAVLHSETKLGVYSCGQFYPKKEKIYFSVVDLGIGMRQKINNFNSLQLTAVQAIDWALTPGNTTKNSTGGLGLKLLAKFIDLNGGSLQIVSDAAYWGRKNKINLSSALEDPFPGTVVVIEINTGDSASYSLATHLKNENIF